MRLLSLFLFMTGLLSAGCISTKTSFRDYSELGAAPFDYVQKNASYTHHGEGVMFFGPTHTLIRTGCIRASTTSTTLDQTKRSSISASTR